MSILLLSALDSNSLIKSLKSFKPTPKPSLSLDEGKKKLKHTLPNFKIHLLLWKFPLILFLLWSSFSYLLVLDVDFSQQMGLLEFGTCQELRSNIKIFDNYYNHINACTWITSALLQWCLFNYILSSVVLYIHCINIDIFLYIVLITISVNK